MSTTFTGVVVVADICLISVDDWTLFGPLVVSLSLRCCVAIELRNDDLVDGRPGMRLDCCILGET